jgi:hypothetical protein
MPWIKAKARPMPAKGGGAISAVSPAARVEELLSAPFAVRVARDDGG